MGRLEEAEADGRELLGLADRTGDPGTRALALHVLGGVAHVRRDYEYARSLHEHLAALARQTGDVALLVRALDSGLADIALNESRFGDAAELSAAAFEIARTAGHVEQVITPLGNLGSALLALGRADEASDRFAESLRRAHEVRDRTSIAWALEGLGAAAAALGRAERAACLLGAADAELTASRQCLDPYEARRHEQLVAHLRDELGEQAFTAAWARGAAMPRDAVSAFALREDRGTGRRA
jgi:tetratricopeptide (TPR) repeat protein